MQRVGWLGKVCAFVALVGLTGGCVSQSKYDNLLDHNRRLTDLLNNSEAEKERSVADLQQANGTLDTMKKMAEGLDADNRALRDAMERAKQVSSQIEKELAGLEGVSYKEGKLTLEGEVFFDSGKATIKKKMEDTLTKVAQALKQAGLGFRIDGHTDSQPITKSGWKSNHDLAAARALTVFHFFEDQGIGEDRMYIAAYGPNKPKVQGKPGEAVRENRRVEILLMSGAPTGTGGAPKKAAGAPATKKAAPAAPAPKPKT
jgi:chemotaxis protein MotB